jgi:hypothetical protein
MSTPVKFGQPIPLELNLETAPGGTRYVKATVTYPNGSQVPGSPATLGLVNAKRFVNSTDIAMPDTPHVKAVYEVFDDVSFMTPSADYGDGAERFHLDEVQIVGGGGGSSDMNDIVGVVEDTSVIVGVVDSDDQITGEVSDEVIVGVVSVDEVTGVVDTDEITGTVEADDDPVGTVE